MKNIFKINIFTYLFLILSMLSGYFREIFIVYLILIIHELGHFFLMKIMKIKIHSITLYPYGGMIKSNMLINTNSLKVILISMGGIINQLLLWILVYLFYKLNIISLYYYKIFFKYNLYIIFFNLIPMYPLDGFKLINNFFELFISFKKSLILSFIINLVCLIVFLSYLYMYNINNYIIVIFLLVSFINYLKNIKYVLNKFYVERVIYDINYNGMISVRKKDNMLKNKYNYINGVGEKNFLISNYYIY